jgi:hypothetical protein
MPCPLISSTDADALRLLVSCGEAFPIATRCGITQGPPAYAMPAGPGSVPAGSGGDDRSPVYSDTPAGLAGHVPDLGHAALPALAYRGRALAAADPAPAEPRYLRGPCPGERHAVHDVGGSGPFLPSLSVLSASHELNVRTYVHLDDVPGGWRSSALLMMTGWGL